MRENGVDTGGSIPGKHYLSISDESVPLDALVYRPSRTRPSAYIITIPPADRPA